MKTLISLTVKVTTPYELNNAQDIRADYTKMLRGVIQRLVQDELFHLSIVGLAVEVKERKV